jgi:hypothetical protein
LFHTEAQKAAANGGGGETNGGGGAAVQDTSDHTMVGGAETAPAIIDLRGKHNSTTGAVESQTVSGWGGGTVPRAFMLHQTDHEHVPNLAKGLVEQLTGTNPTPARAGLAGPGPSPRCHLFVSSLRSTEVGGEHQDLEEHRDTTHLSLRSSARLPKELWMPSLLAVDSSRHLLVVGR